MRSVTSGALFIVATAAITTAFTLVVACATGTDNVDIGEAGIVGDDAARDVNVLPLRDSSSPADDTGVPPEEDSGGGCTKKVVINELMTRSSAGADVEFVELYNPNTCAVPLGSWRLAYKSAAGNGNTVLYTFGTGDSIVSKSYLLVASAGFVGQKDATFVANMFMADNGQVALQDDTMKIVDAVGFGSATGVFVEKNSGPAPTATQSVGRKPNAVDTDDNAADFETLTPSPRAAN